MRTKSLLPIILLTLACSSRPSVDRIPDPPPGADFLVNVRPVVLTTNGQSWWNEENTSPRFEVLQQTWSSEASISFNVLPTEYLENPELYDIDGDAEFHELCKMAKDRSDNNHELCVFFVRNIIRNGREAGGLASYPSNRANSIYQHGIIISVYSYKNVVAHEIGHAFNLPHVWDDAFSDTPSSGQDDCAEPVKFCNLMSYCENHFDSQCDCLYFSDEQVREIRKWCLVPPRSSVITTNMVKSLSVVGNIYTTSTQPVE